MTEERITYLTPSNLASPSRLVGERVMARLIAKYLSPDGRDVLDLGCGSGVCRFLFKTARYTGIDIIDGKFASKLDEETSFAVADASAIPIADEAQDFVFCSYAFEYFSRPLQSLQEIKRILRPGGRALLCVPTAWVQLHEWPAVLFRRKGLLPDLYLSGAPNERFYSPQKLSHLALRAGLAPVEVQMTCGPTTFIFKAIWLWLRFGRFLLLKLAIAILWRLTSSGAKLSGFLKRYQSILPDQRVQNARNIQELRDIRADAIAGMSVFDRVYVGVVKACDGIDRALFSRLSVEYALVVMKK
jgi:SAM-dependent methyltransferase